MQEYRYEKITPLGNKLGEWITLRADNYYSDLAGEQYSVGREVLCWDVDGNSAEDTVVMLEVFTDFAGDRKTSPRTIFPRLLVEDNPVISW